MRLTYANVTSSIALFVALGGTSYAVARLPRDSVGSAQVKDGSLQSRDLAPGTASGTRGPRGPAGPPGAVGPAGPTGPPGPAPVESWRGLSFVNGWTNYGDIWQVAEFRKDQLGVVHLRGLVTQAAGTPDTGSVVAVLPQGYRPAVARIFTVDTGTTHAAGRVNVLANGEITWSNGATGEKDFTSLDGVSFDAP